jgi:hypothetical protein
LKLGGRCVKLITTIKTYTAMANLFIGIVKEKSTGAIVHEHFSQYSDDNFYVEIWGEDSNKPLIHGEFIKWYNQNIKLKK